MSTSAIMGRISYRQESRASLNTNNRTNSLAFDLTNNILLYSPSGTDYYEFYPGKVSATGSVSSIGISSTTLNVSGSPVTSSGIIGINLKPFGTSGNYTKVQTDSFGRVVSGGSLLVSDIPVLNYLPTSGISNGSLSASQADKLKTSRTITLSGDVSSISQSFDGSSNIGFGVSLVSTGVVSGSYGTQSQISNIVIDSKGRITSAGNISISFPQSVSSVGLSSTNLSISNSPVTSSGTISVNLSTIGSSGTFTKSVVDSFGRVISGTTLTSADIPLLNYLSTSGISNGSLSASQADKLKTSRNITLSGDVQNVQKAFDGSSDVDFSVNLNNTGVVSGVYGSVIFTPQLVIDSKGRIISATNVFTSSTGSSGTSGNITIGLNSNTLSISNSPVTGNGFIGVELTTLGTSGNYVKVQTDSYGRVVSGSDLTSADIPILNYLPTSGISNGSLSASQSDKLKTSRTFSISGDISATSQSFDGSSNVGFSTTLSNTSVVSGSYGSQTQVPSFVVDSKGRLTSAGNISISFPQSVSSVGLSSTTFTISNSPITSSGIISVNLSSIGTSGNYVKVQTDSYGRVISGSALTSADIPLLNYLSISGGNILGTISANTFLKNGGTSGQFLKADGTIDLNTYLPTSGISIGSLSASQADKLKTSRTFSLSGDISATAQSFDGSSNVVFSTILSSTSVTPGTYGSQTQIPTFTVDSKGRLTSAGNFTISNSSGVSSVGLSSTSLSISNSPITSSGTISVNLSAVGTSGVYTKIQTDSFGRVVSGSTLTSADIPPLNYLQATSAIQASAFKTIGGTSAQFVKGDGSLDFGNGFQNIIYQNLYLVSGTSGNVSATSGTVKTFNYNLKPNMIGLLVSGTSAGSYSATYNIYSTTDGINFSGIVYGTITNSNNVDSSIFLNIYKDTSFVADLSVSGTVGAGGINITVNS